MEKKKALYKDIYKEIAKSKTRFLSIMLMIALGSFVFVGLYLTGPTMRNTLLSYAQAYNLPDMIVTSPTGLVKSDQQILASVGGTATLDFAYRSDVMCKDTDVVVRVESLGKLPGYEVIAGRLPEASYEIALDSHMQKLGYQLGQRISFVRKKLLGEYALYNYDYVIVGFINSPEYLLPSQMGTSMTGDGVVDYFGVLSKQSFAMENYSLARLTFDNVQGLDAYSQTYKERMLAHTDEIAQLFEAQPDYRYYQTKSEGNKEIAAADQVITEAEKALEDASLELKAAKIKLNEGWEEYKANKAAFEIGIQSAQKEIADNQSKLAQAKKELDEGYDQLTAGRQKLDKARAEYNEGQKQMQEYGRQIEDGQKQLNDAKNNLDQAAATLALQKAQVLSGLGQVNSAIDAIDNGLNEIAVGLAELQRGLSQLEAGIRQTENDLADLNTGIAGLESQIAAIDHDLGLLKAALAELAGRPEDDPEVAALRSQIAVKAGQRATLLTQQNEMLSDRDTAQGVLTRLLAEKTAMERQQTAAVDQRQDLLRQRNDLVSQRNRLNGNLADITAGEDLLRRNKQAFEIQRAAFEQKKDEYEAGLSELAAGQREIIAGEAELAAAEAKLQSGQKIYDAGLIQIANAQKLLAAKRSDGEKQLAAAYEQLQAGEDAYHAGLREYNEKLAEAREDIAEGKTKLADAKKDLARLKVMDYEFRHRYKDEGFYQYIEDSESLDLLSYVFPVFFYLIALLVSITTMTRMVDEQRIQMGTLKALGYTNQDIFKKFFIYGSVTSIVGSLIGIIAGKKYLMPIVFVAYSSNFLFTEPRPVSSAAFGMLAIAISLACTSLAAYLTTRNTLKNKVAMLLRPKAPKNGNRILLERVPLLWRRLSFFYKVTARNIFRYKKRMIMTIVGVAGCTALIFMGFGIRDSVAALLDKQYGQLFLYDTLAIYDDLAEEEEIQAYTETLKQDPRVEQVCRIRFEQGTIAVPNSLDQTVSVVTPMDETAFYQVNRLRERSGQKTITLPKNGAVITEKLAYLLSIGVGDQLQFKDDNGEFQTIEISNITENYTGHYIYLSVAGYERVFNTAYQPNGDFIVLKDHSEDGVSSFAKEMLDKDMVLSVINSNLITETIEELMAAMNIIVLVIIIVSSLLSIVVLYNLTNINILERHRELSTMKVLGFYPKEVTAYVYRETTILTVIGIFIGYFLGWLLHQFIVRELPPSNVLLDPSIKGMTFILSTLFTIFFSMIVMLIVHYRLKGINMVEALKAVE